MHTPEVTLTLTVIEDSVTLRSRDLALLKLAKVELETSGAERSFPASRDISYKIKIRGKLSLYSTAHANSPSLFFFFFLRINTHAC